MKNSFAGLTLAVVIAAGCSQGTPGGPGAKSEKTSYGQVEDTFNLSVPLLSSSVQQGAKADAIVGIKRAKNFGEDVSLTFSDVPEGVTVVPAKPMIKHGDTEAKFAFKATGNASVGDFKVKVTGHPTKGADAQVDFKLTIAAKDTFKLSAPLLSTSIKQGETKIVSIGISRDKSFDQDVALQFENLPKGVTSDPAEPVIKHGDNETQVKFTSADDASLGNFTVQMNGHPANGADATSELKLTVAKQ